MTQTLALGIDIGGTNTSFGLVDARGTVLGRGKIPTTGHGTVEEYAATLHGVMKPVIEQAGRENIKGVGIGAPNGNFYTGEIAFAPNLPWHDVIPLAEIFSKELGLHCTITNDANAAAIGEMTYGAAKGMSDFIMVTLGTGLGSGFVSNGKIIYGHTGFAGELGHVTAVRGGRTCGCGRRGCLEAYCSATGIVRTADEWLEERDDDTMLREHKGNIKAHMIQDAANSGDAFALELYDFTAKILGETLADMVAITSPQAIVFFGGVANAGDLLLAPAKKYMEDSMLNIFKNKVQFMLSGLQGADAAILGASALVW